ncbi:MAG TPA: phytanoyl-CoA dioxygenase family protein [Candidatus Sumerlaeota bacterium]|nr:phytanoyl-CoA dioxygenase family protein [Candidatus Sumerlaeota bacterium]HOR28739.1 phytanoyl-CoA dioxygenase family protein [Candidatus Sumerlaeota bacterium]HPK03009.1 phytanoyl-CoA dioxygenase family protein [Candidatus Sumerlaeota bacterium]
MELLVKLGDVELEYGGPLLGELRESDPRSSDATLRERLENDGYLLIRGLHPRDQIERARLTILEYLAGYGVLDPDAPLTEGRINLAQGPSGGFQPDMRAMSRYFSARDDINDIVLAPERMNLIERLLGGPALSFDYRWMRIMGHAASTPAHCDIVYMGLGARRLLSVWTPFMDVPLDQGGLALCAGSHRWTRLRETYGAMDHYRDRTEALFDSLPLELSERWGGHWLTTHFRMGDVLVFDAYLLHASLENQTDRFRLSLDSRYQLRADPVDERWMGENPYSLEARRADDQQKRPLCEARREWGI